MFCVDDFGSSDAVNLTVCIQTVVKILLLTMNISFYAGALCILVATCDQAAQHLSWLVYKTFYSISGSARMLSVLTSITEELHKRKQNGWSTEQNMIRISYHSLIFLWCFQFIKFFWSVKGKLGNLLASLENYLQWEMCTDRSSVSEQPLNAFWEEAYVFMLKS